MYNAVVCQTSTFPIGLTSSHGWSVRSQTAVLPRWRRPSLHLFCTCRPTDRYTYILVTLVAGIGGPAAEVAALVARPLP